MATKLSHYDISYKSDSYKSEIQAEKHQLETANLILKITLIATTAISLIAISGGIIYSNRSVCVASAFSGLIATITAVAKYIIGGLLSGVPQKYLHRNGWQPSERKSDEFAKRNFQKALQEHGKDPCYATPEEVARSLEAPAQETLGYTIDEAVCRSLEDNKFSVETDEYILAGVFDGYRGSATSTFLTSNFLSEFSLQEGFIVSKLEKTFDALEKQLQHDNSTSEAVITFIHKETLKVYTATLGNSEASILRNIDGKEKAIPLSCVRNSKSKSDMTRQSQWKATNHMEREEHFEALNSRVFGGIEDKKVQHGVTFTTHKPKITVTQFRPGDKVILLSGNLKSYLDSNAEDSTLQDQQLTTLEPLLESKPAVNSDLGSLTDSSSKKPPIVTIEITKS